MATPADVRRIALSLPATEQEGDRFAFAVRNKGKLKGFAWVWMERVTPKKPRVPNPGVIAVRVPNLAHKDLMISVDPAKFFTEAHYEGFPAVLVRLDAVSVAELKVLLEDGWRCQAPADVVKRPKQKTAVKSPRPTQGKIAKRGDRAWHRRGNAS
jgi:hypothetical protein